MFRYFRKRILFFIPALLVMSLVIFGLSRLIPGDPVLNFIENKHGEIVQEEYQRAAARLGLDKPLFYFAISSAAYPDTLYQVMIKDHQSTLRNLISQYGNSKEVIAYFGNIGKLGQAIRRVPDSLKSDATIEIRRAYSQLFIQYEDAPINSYLNGIQTNYQAEALVLKPYLEESTQQLINSYQSVKANASRWKLLIPDVKWFGANNQYHHWITSFFIGDFGNSYRNGRPVSKRIKEAIRWTLTMNLVALLLVLLISIPIGVYSAVKKDSLFDRLTSIFLFVLFSIPNFWIATLFLVFLTTPEYSEYLDWFPSTGLGDLSPEIPFWNRFWDRAAHMVLPIICLTYAALAYFSRQIRGAMVDTFSQDFIRTARSKGVSERAVIWRHAFRNSLFPLISIIAMIFPAMLAGAVIVEFIFNIPGMGRLVFDSIIAQDWPIVYTILMFTAMLAMLGNLIGDLLYAWADPRVNYK